MTAFLPHNDPDPYSRIRGLQQARSTYTYNYTHVSPLAVVDRVPIRDEFTADWIKTVGERVVVSLANMAEIEIDEFCREHHLTRHSMLFRMLTSGLTAIRALKHVVGEALKFSGRIGADTYRSSNLEEFAGLFHKIGLPPIAANFQQDKVFAEMRLAGPNPVMLQLVQSMPDNFPVTDEHLRQAVSNDSLEAAFQEGRLFLCDYSILNHVDCGDFPHGQKYLYAPLAMFVVEKTTGDLLPFAIQAKQRPGAKNPVFSPKDGFNWLIAKTIVEIADGNVHESVTHLGRTHLFVEPFVVSTFRQLSPRHPIGRLLAPHFQGTLAINEAAWQHLIANKGAVDKLLGVTIDDARRLTAEGVQTFRVNDAFQPLTFSARGVANAETLPNYAYRDDSMLYWEAIHEWVASYVNAFYPNDNEVCEDIELQSWYRELIAKDGGRIAGFGREGGLYTKDYLAEVVSLVIFTASVQHAAVNFPQYDLMSYVPNMPLAGYAPAPESKTGATAQDYLNMLPPMDMAELQMELGYLLGTVHYTQLGHYEEDYFVNPAVKLAHARFLDQLQNIGQTIAERNASRIMPYNFLVPSGVPQSINI